MLGGSGVNKKPQTVTSLTVSRPLGGCLLPVWGWFKDSTRSHIFFYLQHIQTYLILLHFSDTAFFYKVRVCCKSALNKSVGAISPTAFAHFVSLYHIFIILTISQIFFIITLVIWIYDQ